MTILAGIMRLFYGIRLLLCKKYEIKRSKRIRTHSAHEVNANFNVEIGVDIRMVTYTKQSASRPDSISC